MRASLALAALLLPSVAFAQQSNLFIGMSGGEILGTEPVGHGSREAFGQPAFAWIDLRHAHYGRRSHTGIEWGVELFFVGPYTSTGGAPLGKLLFGRLEGAATYEIVWPRGELALGIGGGGDAGRYWWDARMYPLAYVRERTKLGSVFAIDAISETLPVAATPYAALFEQRFELRLSIKAFSIGARWAYTTTLRDVGRNYEQHEIMAVVGAQLDL